MRAYHPGPTLFLAMAATLVFCAPARADEERPPHVPPPVGLPPAPPDATPEPRPAEERPVPAAPADPATLARARTLVAALAAAEDEPARRDLLAIGAPALSPLAEALPGAAADLDAFARLAGAFDAILRNRLQDLDAKLGKLERDRAEAQPGEPLQGLSGEAAAIVEAVERDVLDAAGYAAAFELFRPGGARDELSALARGELLQDLRKRFEAEAAAVAGSAGERERLIAHLAGLAYLAGPLLLTSLGDVAGAPPADGTAAAAARDIATAARDRMAARLTALLGDAGFARRVAAAESLFRLGDVARPALEGLAARKDATAHERHEAKRLLQRIRWSISEELYERIGGLLEGYEDLAWRERRRIAYEVEKQGGPEAVPALRKILGQDPSAGVRVVAAEGLVRLGDPLGREYLERAHLALPMQQSPEMKAAIAMDQGIKYLQIKRYDKALKEFEAVLAVQPRSDIGFYNLACTYALMGDVERGLDCLEKAVACGFVDWRHMEKDRDLDALRSSPRYRKVLEDLQRANPDPDEKRTP